MPLDALSDEHRYKHGVNDHFSQAVYTGFGNFSAVDIPVIVKLPVCVSSVVWNTYSCSSLRYLSNVIE